ncbi:hypothetical protein [Anaerovorax sp. IOR16]|uniref:hypothetical protein n=1 Tax=Anaerovorax sp. IOR16 TaxID=2773458 RepID=UPI0019CF59A4|nr:hypothetical protein [Anaerovorax sp. IOR16]
MSFMYLDSEEYEFIWETVSKLQIVFHPRYSPDGQLDHNALIQNKHKYNYILILDRNMLSSLLRLFKEGSLKDENEMRVIALVMSWALTNNFPISAGLAIKEFANRTMSQDNALQELCEFKGLFEYYPSIIWLRLAEGVIDKIPPVDRAFENYETDINYPEYDDHLLMHIAEMLHIVYLYRKKDMPTIEKIEAYLKWNYENLLISESTITYMLLLFTNQNGIKAPKGVMTNDYEKILSGCKNQAWDLNYLSTWSTFHYNEPTENNEIFLFTTNDVMLKKIFINTYSSSGLSGLIHAVLSSKDGKRICDLIQQKSGTNRIKPDFGNSPREYFNDLITREKELLSSSLNFC